MTTLQLVQSERTRVRERSGFWYFRRALLGFVVISAAIFAGSYTLYALHTIHG